MKRPGSSKYPNLTNSQSISLTSFQTPYDDIFPNVDDKSARFYLDVMRIYLGLVSNTLSLENAQMVVEQLKENPEYVRSPIDPTLIPLRDSFKQNILDNLRTLLKFNLLTTDSIRSACSFAFLVDIVPLSVQESEILTYFSIQPIATINKASRDLNLATRTVSRALSRLKNQYRFRFNSLMNDSVFGLQTVLVFFTPRSDIDWTSVEDALYSYPLTKIMLKTTMVDLGYISIIIPTSGESVFQLEQSISLLSKTIFNYTSVHHQTGIGTTRNISLYKNGEWSYPDGLESAIEKETSFEITTLWNTDRISSFSEIDFLIGSVYKLDCRAPPRKISKALSLQGYDIAPKQITHSLKKFNKFNIQSPYISIAGLGLDANFCFEIICNDYWKNRILSILPHLPLSTYNVTSRGIIIWIQVPSNQQVDYYKIFRSFEKQDGVTSVLPIMTISQKGSRSISDLVRYWKFGKDGWVLCSEVPTLSDHVSSAY
ncbi:MAG: hypothetical protein ACTSQZ_05460 [Candidatus Thorarchaeota archaeon]